MACSGDWRRAWSQVATSSMKSAFSTTTASGATPEAEGSGSPASSFTAMVPSLAPRALLRGLHTKGVFPEGENRGRGARAGGRDLGKRQVPGLERLPRHPGRRAFQPPLPPRRAALAPAVHPPATLHSTQGGRARG